MRCREAVAERKALSEAFKAGVTPEGVQVFMSLTKTIGNTVTWKGCEIIVSGDVLIAAPYRPENCSVFRPTNKTTKEGPLNYVQTLLKKYWSEQGKAPSQERQTATGPASAAPPEQSASLPAAAPKATPPVAPAASTITATAPPTAASIVAKKA